MPYAMIVTSRCYFAIMAPTRPLCLKSRLCRCIAFCVCSVKAAGLVLFVIFFFYLKHFNFVLCQAVVYCSGYEKFDHSKNCRIFLHREFLSQNIRDKKGRM